MKETRRLMKHLLKSQTAQYLLMINLRIFHISVKEVSTAFFLCLFLIRRRQLYFYRARWSILTDIFENQPAKTHKYLLNIDIFLCTRLKKEHFVFGCQILPFFRRDHSLRFLQITFISHQYLGYLLVAVICNLCHPVIDIVKALSVAH